MIYTRFHGRTGNQMFQWAAGRALASRHGTTLAVDDRETTRRGIAPITDIFDLPATTPAQLPPMKSRQPLRYLLWRRFGRNPVFRRERGLGYNPGFAGFSDNSYLHGYWQSERYFAGIADDLRRDFTFPGPVGRNADLLAEIATTLSVSLHVRRGDYLSAGSFAICDQAYYDAALNVLLPELEGEPTIYVFSDDPDWARQNLRLPGLVVVVDHNRGGQDWEDMALMSRSRHNIIANSSFSWWAAWLNANPEKRVIAPARWYGDGKTDNPDILPPGWRAVKT